MPVYVEMVVDKKTGKKIEKKVNDKKQYYIRTYVKDSNGKPHQVTRHNKNWLGKDGYIEASQEENKLKRGFLKQQQNLTFEEIVKLFYNDYSKKLKESSMISYEENIKNLLLPFFKGKKITYRNVFLWHQSMESTSLSIPYLNKANTVLSVILDVAIKYEIIDRNFVKDIGCFHSQQDEQSKKMKKIRYITYDEFCVFISKIDNRMWYTVFYLLYYTGMRKGELIALTWNDIDIKNKKIYVNKTYTDRTNNGSYNITATKNCKEREIDLNDSTIKVINEWYYSENKKSEIIKTNFVFGREHPISTTTMTNRKNKYFKLSGLNKTITIQEFRHSHVSLLINEYLKMTNGDTDTAKFMIMMSNRMGHTIEVMQKTYMHLFPEVQRPITKLLNNLEKQDQKQDQKK
jgi:integrase